VDLLVTDQRMPWLTGFQAALSARRAGLSMPIIMVTAFPDNELSAKVSSLGAAVVLAKPFQPEELLSLVRCQLAAA
jgi:DNA-binding response OmpR family regulator